MAADKSKTFSVRLDHDHVVAIEEHMVRLRAEKTGIQFSFTDALNHIIAVGLAGVSEKARKRA